MGEMKTAAEIIGPGTADDWKIDPTGHARLYRSQAPGFADVLESEPVARAAKHYESTDAEAVEAQKSFRTMAEPANEWVLSATVAGSAVLFFQALFPGEWPVRLAGLAAAVTGLGGLVYVSILRERGDLDRWKRARAESEQARTDYFAAVLEVCGDDPQLAELGFEYARRYLYASQLAYFEKRGAEHAAAARSAKDRVAGLRAASVGLLGLGGAGAIFSPMAGAIAAGAGAVSAVAAYFAGEEQWNQDAANAGAYRSVKGNLLALGTAVDRVRSVAPEERAEAGMLVFKEVRAALLEEHSQWLEDFAKRQEAIDTLQERLTEMNQQSA